MSEKMGQRRELPPEDNFEVEFPDLQEEDATGGGRTARVLPNPPPAGIVDILPELVEVESEDEWEEGDGDEENNGV